MVIVSRKNGSVTTKTIAETEVMNLNVQKTNAIEKTILRAETDIASRNVGGVTVT